MKRKSARTPLLLSNYVILSLLVVFSLGPLIMLGFNAFKSPDEIGLNPFGPPAIIDLSNFRYAWELGNFTITVRNSLIVVLGTVPGVCAISGLAAFALARLKPPGGDALAAYLLVVTALPPTVFLVPLFFLWSKLGLTESLLGLCIIYWAINSPLATLLLRSYMVSVPDDYEDAARVDGADDWDVLRHVILPMVWPGFLTVALVAGLAAWNEYLFVYTFIHEPELKTVITSYQSFAGRFTRDLGLTSAAAIITILPVALFFLALQNYFIEGLTSRRG